MVVEVSRGLGLGLIAMVGLGCPAGEEGTGTDPSDGNSTGAISTTSGSSTAGDEPSGASSDDGTPTADDASTGSSESSGSGDSTSTGDPACDLEELLDAELWDELFLHKDDPACSGQIYTWQGLVDAAADYPTFACEGDELTRRRELAAFLAQISHETTGGWPAAPDGPHSWGLCFIEEVGCEDNACPQYCDAGNAQYPCMPGVTYHGRGAIQLSWNYNYGQAGDALGVDLLSDPDLVRDDSTLAIQTALWFWMTEQPPKPSAHDVMVGHWAPSPEDEALGRLPGFGMTTNIINGGLECGMPSSAAVEDRVGFLTRYVGLLETDVGDNVYCDMMTPY